MGKNVIIKIHVNGEREKVNEQLRKKCIHYTIMQEEFRK